MTRRRRVGVGKLASWPPLTTPRVTTEWLDRIWQLPLAHRFMDTPSPRLLLLRGPSIPPWHPPGPPSISSLWTAFLLRNLIALTLEVIIGVIAMLVSVVTWRRGWLGCPGSGEWLSRGEFVRHSLLLLHGEKLPNNFRKSPREVRRS